MSPRIRTIAFWFSFFLFCINTGMFFATFRFPELADRRIENLWMMVLCGVAAALQYRSDDK
jgi:hypothetical protein